MINKLAFVLIAGRPERWDEEIRIETARGESLTYIQEEQWRRGRRSAELSKNGNGWVVRSAMGLDGWAILSPSFDKKSDAVAWGTTWANNDPTQREFFVRREKR